MIENVYGRKYAERNFSYFSNLNYRSSDISVYNNNDQYVRIPQSSSMVNHG